MPTIYDGKKLKPMDHSVFVNPYLKVEVMSRKDLLINVMQWSFDLECAFIQFRDVQR